MGDHAKLSASGSKKWLNCPLSLTLEKEFKDSTSSYAYEGTLAHELAEVKLNKDIGSMRISDYENAIEEIKKETEKNGFDFSEMQVYTNNYIEFVDECSSELKRVSGGIYIHIEQKLDYSYWAEDGFGTGDCVLVGTDTLHIIDFKYGKGIRVEAENNTQLMLYGLGALNGYDLVDDIKKVKLSVFQPRIDNISTWEISSKELYSFGENEVKPKAILALKGDGEATAGIHCVEGFCKARSVCKAFANRHIDTVKLYECSHPSLLNKEEIAHILDIADTYKKWLDTVKAFTLEQMLQGNKFSGLKLVEGKSNRVFQDKNEVIKTLKGLNLKKSEYIEEDLLSVSKLEKKLGKDKFDKNLGTLVIKPNGSPTIAKSSDKRLEYNSAESDFKELINTVDY